MTAAAGITLDAAAAASRSSRAIIRSKSRSLRNAAAAASRPRPGRRVGLDVVRDVQERGERRQADQRPTR